jgi:hypothetical protein
LVFRASWGLSGSDWYRNLTGLDLLRFLRRHSLFMHEYLILKFLRLLLAIGVCLIRYLILNGHLYLKTEFLKVIDRGRALLPVRP